MYCECVIVNIMRLLVTFLEDGLWWAESWRLGKLWAQPGADHFVQGILGPPRAGHAGVCCECCERVCVFLYVAEKWSPALQIRTVLLSIQALLSAPNPDDPLANDVAEQWKVNEAQAIETGNH